MILRVHRLRYCDEQVAVTHNNYTSVYVPSREIVMTSHNTELF